MTDLSITAASVIAGANAKTKHGFSGASNVAGKILYRDPASQKFLLADSNSATVAARTPSAMALNGASDGQPITVLEEGDVAVGAILTPGVTYYLSDTPGGICPLADVGSGEYISIVGVAKSTTVLAVKFQSTGVAN